MTAFSVVAGDITQLDVDAIVNAANETLLGGGGIDGAIHRHAGPELLKACYAIPEVMPGVRCPIGEARLTPAFCLSAKFIIHTVGPRWHDGTEGEAEYLAACYRNCLTLAERHHMQSVAFPAISTGVFRYPIAQAARIAVAACLTFVKHTPSLELITLVGLQAKTIQAYDDALRQFGIRYGIHTR